MFQQPLDPVVRQQGVAAGAAYGQECDLAHPGPLHRGDERAEVVPRPGQLRRAQQEHPVHALQRWPEGGRVQEVEPAGVRRAAARRVA